MVGIRSSSHGGTAQLTITSEEHEILTQYGHRAPVLARLILTTIQ
jgi:hypothetical protein